MVLDSYGSSRCQIWPLGAATCTSSSCCTIQSQENENRVYQPLRKLELVLDPYPQSGLLMVDSHVDMPAPTIVTMFLKPCSRQCASRPSKVNSGITYIRSSCLNPIEEVNLFKTRVGPTLSTTASSLSGESNLRVFEKNRRIKSIVPSKNYKIS